MPRRIGANVQRIVRIPLLLLEGVNSREHSNRIEPDTWFLIATTQRRWFQPKSFLGLLAE